MSPGPSSEDESSAGRDEDAIWGGFGLLARVFRAWIKSQTLSIDWEESNDELLEDLSVLNDDELSDGVRIAELEGFSELECLEGIEWGKEQGKIREWWKLDVTQKFWKVVEKKESEKLNCEKEANGCWAQWIVMVTIFNTLPSWVNSC